MFLRKVINLKLLSLLSCKSKTNLQGISRIPLINLWNVNKYSFAASNKKNSNSDDEDLDEEFDEEYFSEDEEVVNKNKDYLNIVT